MAWVSGEQTTTELNACFNEGVPTCATHYRGPVVDKWNIIGIQEVNVSLYKSGEEVAYVTFNGTGSNMTSWFSKARFLASSWDLTTSSLTNVFSIFGMPGRRFYINRSFHNCTDDRTYFAVLPDEPKRQCEYDQRDSYPQFTYSTLNGSGNPMLTKEFSPADKFVIRARYSKDGINKI